MPAYFARPDAAMSCAIIVIPESFGVNACIRQKCGDCAAEGYLAIAPDIFCRFAPGVELNPDVEAEFQKALGYFGQYDADLGVKDIEASVRWLRGQGTNRIGCVGFCLGGRLAYMAATRTDVDARSEEHTSELQSLMRISYAVFCMEKKTTTYDEN